MRVEVTIHRIGGPDGENGWEIPRSWGPAVVSLEEPNIALTSTYVHPTKGGPAGLVIRTAELVLVDEEFASLQLILETVDGRLLGRRPALVYRRPYDVPVYCTIQDQGEWNGTFSIGLRVIV